MAMKKRTVESMVRSEFDIPDDVPVIVNVTAYSHTDKLNYFDVMWWGWGGSEHKRVQIEIHDIDVPEGTLYNA